MSGESAKFPEIGVVVVTFNSADVIEDCLESLAATEWVRLRVVVVDNASTDNTRSLVRDRIDAHEDGTQFELIEEPINGGYAKGVNAGLRVLAADPALDLFWVLNPDCKVMPDTARRYLEAARRGPFALLGGRTVFDTAPEIVQTDGGRVSKLVGRCTSINLGVACDDAPFPADETLDFITGASCLASRAFLERAGLMHEGYFLYYEEVDWAFRRGDLPLRYVPQAEVRHIGGTSIGSGSIGRRATPFSNYFNYRGRALFLRRFRPMRLPFGLAFGAAKAAHLILSGHRREGWAIIAGMFGLAPPREVQERLTPESLALATGRKRPSA